MDLLVWKLSDPIACERVRAHLAGYWTSRGVGIAVGGRDARQSRKRRYASSDILRGRGPRGTPSGFEVTAVAVAHPRIGTTYLPKAHFVAAAVGSHVGVEAGSCGATVVTGRVWTIVIGEPVTRFRSSTHSTSTG